MMDHKGQMNDGPHNNFGVTPGRMGPLRRTVPILDDRDIWTDAPVVRTDADAARYWAAKHGEALQAIQDLRSDLSGARFERDIWWPLAFAVGLLTGWGLTWLM